MLKTLLCITVSLVPIQLCLGQMALPPGLTRDLSKAAVSLPAGALDACPLGSDPIVNIKDGTLLIHIPAGEFIIGSDRWPEEGGEALKVTLDHSYYIALHEITNAQYKRFVQETRHRAPEQYDGEGEPEPTWKGNTFPADRADHPVIGVSWSDAEAYCKWAGLRLPSEPEWEKAARGTDGRAWPWGNEFDPSLCRSEVVERTGTGPVYEHPAGRSPYGLFAAAGNVAEWCLDWYHGAQDYEAYRRNDLSPRTQGAELRVTRGGGWYTAEFDFLLRTSQRGHCPPDERHCEIGFRAAWSPPGQ